MAALYGSYFKSVVPCILCEGTNLLQACWESALDSKPCQNYALNNSNRKKYYTGLALYSLQAILSLQTVLCSVVEAEFWRILQDYSTYISFEYGAEVHSIDKGSGFPTEQQLEKFPHLFSTPEQREQALAYARSPWNLNNLPIYGK